MDLPGAVSIRYPILHELRRRHVVKNALLYVVTSWLILQAADVLFPALRIQDWAFPLLLGLLLLFFVPALIFSWVYEMTPEGLRREKDVDHGSLEMVASGVKINKVIAVLLTLAIVLVGLDRLFPASAASVGASACGEDRTSEASAGDPAGASGPARPPGRSIAVFPFVSRSGDARNEHFSASMTEQVLNLLARLPELQVTSRMSALATSDHGAGAAASESPLNVASILEGSVQHEDGQFRITARLIAAGSDRLLWSGTFDRPTGHVLLAQDEIAARIVDGVVAALLTGFAQPEEGGTAPASVGMASMPSPGAASPESPPREPLRQGSPSETVRP